MQDNIIYILSIYNRQCRNIYLPEKDSAYTQKVHLFTSVKIFIKMKTSCPTQKILICLSYLIKYVQIFRHISL